MRGEDKVLQNRIVRLLRGRKSTRFLLRMKRIVCLYRHCFMYGIWNIKKRAVRKAASSKRNCSWLLLSHHTLSSTMISINRFCNFLFSAKKNPTGSEFDQGYCIVWNPHSCCVCLSFQDCRRITLFYCYCTGNRKKKIY